MSSDDIIVWDITAVLAETSARSGQSHGGDGVVTVLVCSEEDVSPLLVSLVLNAVI